MMATRKNGEESANNWEKVKLLRKEFEKKYGEGVITVMGDEKYCGVEVVSTGLLGLDIALGMGGIALGRIHELYGPPGCGKSTLLYTIYREAIRAKKRILHIDTEHSVPVKYLRAIGVDVNEIVVVSGHTGEQQLEMMINLIKTEAFDVVGIDSLAGFVPTIVYDSGFESSPMGAHARLLHKMCQFVVPLAARTRTAVIGVNQLRVNIGSYGFSNTTPGGLAIPFYATIRIKVWGPSTFEQKANYLFEGEKDSKRKSGQRVFFEVQKNKLAAPFGATQADLHFGQGFDLLSDLLDVTLKCGFVKKDGSSRYHYEGDCLGHGAGNTIERLRGDPELCLELRARAKKMYGLELTPEEKTAFRKWEKRIGKSLGSKDREAS